MRCGRAGGDSARALVAEGKDGGVWGVLWCVAAANWDAAPHWRQDARLLVRAHTHIHTHIQTYMYRSVSATGQVVHVCATG